MPTLVIMAAGLGSRYGGLKQIEPISKDGNIIIDYSIYDAYKAGFRDVIFIIKEELLDIFEEKIGRKTRQIMNVSYVFQSIDVLTDERVSADRTKPLGTGHAVLCTKDTLKGSFAIINADDFYGYEPFALLYEFLSQKQDSHHEYALVGYKVENTLTENGYVTRGVCAQDENGFITKIDERKKIKLLDGMPVYTEDEQTFHDIGNGTSVSMNMMGFTNEFLGEIGELFEEFLSVDLQKDPLKAEFLIPDIIDKLILSKKASVKILPTDEKWYGITYKEDKAYVQDSIQQLIEQELYVGI